jgi:hypothetical protein
MVPRTLLPRFLVVTAAATVAAVIAGTAEPAAAADLDACPVSDVEYNVAANIRITDTPFGAADGVYSMGSGKVKLRVEAQPGHEAVKMMSYDLVNRLTVEAKVAMLSTKVVTESKTATDHNACDGSAQGTLHDGKLTWSSGVSGYHSDGTMECSGAMCGKFGAPPRGTSPWHETQSSLKFSPFTFSPDGSTFTMAYTLVSKSDAPKQTTYLALSGRRVKQSCAAPAATACASHLALAN